mgnify:FL=1
MIVAGIVLVLIGYMVYSIIYDSEEIDPNDSNF